MFKNLIIEIKDQLKEHLNKLELNKQLKKKVENEINEILIQLTRLLIRQKLELLKKINENEKILESNLANLINKENNLLKKLQISDNSDEILNDYNELKSLNNNLYTDFDYVFKKNELIDKSLLIGNLLVKNNYILNILIHLNLNLLYF
jgi:hypothetical protein